MQIPMTGHPINTKIMPPKKHPVPRNLCVWKKNRNVRSNPIRHVRPQTKSIYGGWDIDVIDIVNYAAINAVF